jgi:hypothetical protein
MRMELLPLNEQSILSFLQADARASGKIYHFDPDWVMRELDMYELEFRSAARQLASRGLIAIHEFNWKGTDLMTDIALRGVI